MWLKSDACVLNLLNAKPLMVSCQTNYVCDSILNKGTIILLFSIWQWRRAQIHSPRLARNYMPASGPQLMVKTYLTVS